ncbi:hypothetical protein CKO44_19470 [Rubrivivax gelatinosus]|nr:hypothetical protein [Rubrivivax gelatinosus]MBZ8143308.1 hypothetical protein [Rubrivivax gelatinosus]
MSQATVDLVSGFVFVSGQVDWDAGSKVRHATLQAQAEGAIEHLVTVLDEAGASGVARIARHAHRDRSLGRTAGTPVMLHALALGPLARAPGGRLAAPTARAAAARVRPCCLRDR